MKDLFKDTKFRYIHDYDKSNPTINSDTFDPSLNKQGYGVFFTVNGFRGTSATKADLSVINAFYGDFDGFTDQNEIDEKIRSLPIEPTLIVRTKNGIHTYWVLDEPIYKEECSEEEWSDIVVQWEKLENRIVAITGADKNAKDITRVLRVPKTLHQKNPADPFMVKIIKKNEANRYSFRVIDEAFPAPQISEAGEFVYNETTQTEFFKRVNQAFPILERESVKRLLSGVEGTLPTRDPSRNRALLVAASFLKQSGVPYTEALNRFPTWHHMEKERGGKDEILRTIQSAYRNNYTFGYSEPCVAHNTNETERHLYRKAVATAMKEQREVDKVRFIEYHHTFIEQHPHLRITRDGVFYEYESGIYVERNEKEMLHTLLQSMEKDGLIGFLTRSFANDKLANIASNLPRIEEIDVDSNENWVVVENGILDIKERKLLPHTPDYIAWVKIPVWYDPDAKAPVFERFIHEFTNGDESRATILQEFAGYLLTPSNKYHKALFLVGKGGNGKSVFVETMASFFPLNRSSSSLEQINERFGLSELIGKRINVCEEISNHYLQSNKFKAIVSGEMVSAEVKHRTKHVQFKSQVKMLLAVNEMPRLDETSDGTYRRILIVECKRSFVDNPDTDMKDKLKEEQSGILNYMLEGYTRLSEQGKFSVGEEAQALINQYKVENSSVEMFVAEATNEEQGEVVELSDLYRSYKEFCREAGMIPKSSPNFAKELRNHRRYGVAFEIKQRTNGKEKNRVEGLQVIDNNPYSLSTIQTPDDF